MYLLMTLGYIIYAFIQRDMKENGYVYGSLCMGVNQVSVLLSSSKLTGDSYDGMAFRHSWFPVHLSSTFTARFTRYLKLRQSKLFK